MSTKVTIERFIQRNGLYYYRVISTWRSNVVFTNASYKSEAHTVVVGTRFCLHQAQQLFREEVEKVNERYNAKIISHTVLETKELP